MKRSPHSSNTLKLTHVHSISLAMDLRPRAVERLVVSPRSDSPQWRALQEKARDLKIPVEMRGHSKDAPQAFAVVRPKEPESLHSMIPEKVESGIWLALDCVQDPHNVGAIFRAAAFFGVKGVILLEDRSASLTETVYDVSSGGVEVVPHVKESNLRQVIDVCKERGIWVLGTSEHAKQTIQEVPLDRAYLLIVGNEEKGLRKLTQESCDYLVRIDSKTEVKSLNVSVATGVALTYLNPATPAQ